MQTQLRIQRTQTVLIVCGLLLALYYFFLYRPLSKTSESLDEPLMGLWQQLVRTNAQDQTVEGLDADDIQATLQQAQISRVRFEAFRQTLLARLELDPAITRKLSEPFQLIDFQNERQDRIADLSRLAKLRAVELDTNVLEEFPNYPVDHGVPALLWAQLVLCESVLKTAINSGNSRISRINVQPVRSASTNVEGSVYLHEIPLEIELSGSMLAVSRFLTSLPMRSDEVLALGLPEADRSKAPYFIDRLLLTKQSPEQMDGVSVRATVVGYLPAYQPLKSAPSLINDTD